MPSDHINDLLRWVVKVRGPEYEPTLIVAIFASHKVPYGRLYHMYSTLGDLVLYVNRGHLMDSATPAQSRESKLESMEIASPMTFDVPIYFE